MTREEKIKQLNEEITAVQTERVKQINAANYERAAELVDRKDRLEKELRVLLRGG